MTETDKDDSSTHLGTEHETAASPEAATQEGQTSALAVPLTPSEHDGQLATTITQSAQEEGHEFIDPDNLPTTVTPPTAQSETQTHPPTEPEEQFPPEVMSLNAMFPDFEPIIIQSVLESVDGDHERATDALLGMSDPDYVHQETQRSTAPSQTDLDEEFARRLVMEEQQSQSDWENQLGYQPRRQNNPQRGGGGPGDGGSGGKDTMSELSEQFNKFTETSSVQLGKFAETSKKTLSSFMTKVKAKVQEFDSNRNNQGSSGSSQEPSWGAGTGGAGQTQGQQHPQYYQPPSAQPPAVGDYTMAGYDTTPSSTIAPSPLHNYPAPRRVPVPSTDLPHGASDAVGQLQTGTDSSPPPGPPMPPTTSTGPPAGSIDRAKLGMLPKRPVSLSQTPPVNRQDVDEDELDYVENPFEDGRH